ncbi:KpsF/GutQ family sugar-phosphate isomerase [candidate division KSB1 bacterium]|nr:KpsF/GutQ family sugar-phosphate isomerase [candidate division KSB1 bacterium]
MTTSECIEIGKRVIRKEADAVYGLLDKIDESFADAVNVIYKSTGRVVISGMGKSGIIGKKIAATLTSTGTAAFFLHPAESIHGDLGIVHKNDVVIIISKSGDTHEINTILPILKRLGVKIIAMTGNPRSRMAERSDIVLNVSVDEEACPNNLAPTSSTTAALAMGDALAVALLERRHFREKDFAKLHPGGNLGKKLTPIDDVMFTGDRLPIVHETTTFENVILEMTSKRFGSTCVIDDSKTLVGLITDGDIRRLLEDKKDIWALKAVDIMNRNPRTMHEGDFAYNAYKLLTEFSIMQIVIVNATNSPIGIVHLHDLLEAGIY